jgi:hypothetical protein
VCGVGEALDVSVADAVRVFEEVKVELLACVNVTDSVTVLDHVLVSPTVTDGDGVTDGVGVRSDTETVAVVVGSVESVMTVRDTVAVRDGVPAVIVYENVWVREGVKDAEIDSVTVRLEERVGDAVSLESLDETVTFRVDVGGGNRVAVRVAAVKVAE